MKSKHALAAILSTGVFIAVAGTPGVYADETNSAIKDAWLEGKLETTLLFNEHLNSFDIDTEVENGVAYLGGAVESDIDRDLAGEIAKSIKGVSKVENNLVVDQSKSNTFRDTTAYEESQSFRQTVMDITLTASVKSKLLLNSNTSGMAINVDTADGVVTLTGEVGSDEEKELAARIAANTEGTRSVNDMLKVSKKS